MTYEPCPNWTGTSNLIVRRTTESRNGPANPIPQPSRRTTWVFCSERQVALVIRWLHEHRTDLFSSRTSDGRLATGPLHPVGACARTGRCGAGGGQRAGADGTTPTVSNCSP